MEFKVDVKGLKELEKNLLEIANEYGPKHGVAAMRPAVKAATEVLQNDIESNTPKDSGALASTTKAKVAKPSKKVMAMGDFSADTILVGRAGWFWKGKPSFWNQALAVEFGTDDMPASSPLRNSFDKNFNEVIRVFSDKLGKSIEKKATALHNKKSKR
jgi:HK97 gp10 family phage protein